MSRLQQDIAKLNPADRRAIAPAAVHAFDPDVVSAEAEPGWEIASEALATGGEALDELQFRRIGLAVSVLVIGGLIAGLLLKIREIEQPASTSGSHDA